MSKPLISVIVPVYNASKTLSRCVESILSQTFTDFELILVNDGSRDNSGAICDKYASNDIRVSVLHQHNKGVSAARNIGIDNARGKYLAFIDSDDIINADYLEKFEVNINSNVDFVSQGANLIYDDSSRNHSIKFDATEETDLENLYNKSVVNCLIYNPWGKLFRLEILNENNLRFDESISYGEDRIFVALYVTYCEIFKTIKYCGYNYMHENPNCLSQSNHSWKNIYHFAVSHYNIIKKIHYDINISPEIAKKDIIHDVYALYSAIILNIKDNTLSNSSKILFIKSLDKNLFNESLNFRLPHFYRWIGLCVKYLPIPFSLFLIKTTLCLK